MAKIYEIPSEEIERMGDLASNKGDMLLAMTLYALAISRKTGTEVIFVGMLAAFGELLTEMVDKAEKPFKLMKGMDNGRSDAYRN